MNTSTLGTNDNKGFDDASRPQSTRSDQQHSNTPTDAPSEAHDAESREVRHLAQQYTHLDLEQLAPLTRAEEAGSHADRFRSMFGYQWLAKACGTSSDPASQHRLTCFTRIFT